MKDELYLNGSGDPRLLPAAGGAQYDGGGNKQQLEQMLDVLFRRRWTVILTFLIIAAGATAYALTRPPEYRSSALVMVNLSRATNSMQMASGVNPGENVFAMNNRSLAGELFLIQSSHAIAQRVNKRLLEAVERQDSVGTPNPLTYPPRGSVSFSAATREASALRVTGLSTDPREAALLANLYAEEYVRQTQDASRTFMAQSREFLEGLQETRRAELDEAEERLANYKQRTGMVGLDPSGASLVHQLSAMEAQRDNALIELQMKEASYERIQTELETINPRLAERLASGVDQRVASLQGQLQQLEVEKTTILLRYPDQSEAELMETHNQLPAINRQIDQLQSEIRQLASQFFEEESAAGGVADGGVGLSVVSNLRNQAVAAQIDISGLRARIDNMDERIRFYESELTTIPGRSLELARFERDRQHKAQMYEYVVQRLQQARIAEESEPGYAHVMRQAGVPGAPSGPNVPRLIMYGLFIGLAAGIGLAIAKDKIDNRFYKPDQLKRFPYPVLSVIPNMKPLIKEDHDGRDFIEENGRKYSTSLTALLNPISTVSEAYRQLRTNLQFSKIDAPVQVIMVTSAGISEGKSTTAANLAMVMAQAGRRTVLVDCDLRRPQVHSFTGRTCHPGLVQLLFDENGYSLDDAKSEIDNLHIITAGEVRSIANGADAPLTDEPMVVANPAELLGSQRMRELIRRLRGRFDTIIIDTPPVLAATDAAIMSNYADVGIIVVRAAQSREGELEQAIDALRRVDAPIVGTIFNGFDISMAYGYKYRFRNYTKYGQYSKYGYYGYRDDTSKRKVRKLTRKLQRASA